LIRTIWVWLNLFLVTPVLSAICVVAALLGRKGDIYERVGRAWCRRMLAAAGARVRLQGAENVQPGRPHLVISNHASWFDVWALGAHMPTRYSFVAKKELSKIPLFGAAWLAAGHISIDRRDTQSAIRSLREAGERIRRENATVVIFPEGTRSATGELLPFKKGAFMLAIQTGVEVVPTAVIGGRDVLPKGGWRVRPGTIIIRFGSPIPTADLSEKSRDQLIASVRQSMQALLHKPISEENDNVGDRQHIRT
jgi:1-acyl-sn-glycerol-3-phosphate acyltransferase